MHLHIACPLGITNAKAGMGEVGPCMAVMLARVDNFNFFTCSGNKIGMVKAPEPPKEVQEVFFHSKGWFGFKNEDSVLSRNYPNFPSVYFPSDR